VAEDAAAAAVGGHGGSGARIGQWLICASRNKSSD
jgi:hypothetical protein